MYHLNVRVAWHDNRWNGTVCRNPSHNSFCVDLGRIRAKRVDAHEQPLASETFGDFKNPVEFPPCKAENGAFMNSN
jgi:hypothetical protein